jgi:hypothetical protein
MISNVPLYTKTFYFCPYFTERYITIKVIIVCPLGKTSLCTNSVGSGVQGKTEPPALITPLKKGVKNNPEVLVQVCKIMQSESWSNTGEHKISYI